MDLLYSGWIDTDKRLPYSVFDTGTVAESESGASAIQTLSALAGGRLLFSKETGQDDHSIYSNVPSMWRNAGFDRVGQVAHTSDAGFSFSAGAYDGDNTNINGNAHFKVNQYANVKKPSKGALYLHMKGSTPDTNGKMYEYAYDNGVLIRSEIYGNSDVYVLFRNDASVWLLHTSKTFTPKLGFFPPESVVFNLIGTLEPFRVYCLLSEPVRAEGTVFDAAGRPAPNCRVFAYDRADGRLVGSGVSGSDGQYAFTVFAAKGSSLFMVCLDNDDAPDFAAQVQDRIAV